MSMSNQPGTPRDDGEMGGNFLNPFQSESVSIFFYLGGFCLFVYFVNLCHFGFCFFLKKGKNKQFHSVFVMQCCALHVFY